MMPAALRRGWCPGALAPMETGDGWLIRIRPRAGRYRLEHLRAVADAASAFGNGEIDLTNRANLQIRGLRQETVAPAIEALSLAGLIDGDPAAEAIRNVIVSPLAGLDPESYDAHPLAEALEATLSESESLKTLPGKFGFAIEADGALLPRTSIADILMTARRTHVEIRLAGDASLAVAVAESDAAAAVVRLAGVFIEQAQANAALRRMRQAVAASDAEALFGQAGLEPRVMDRGAADNASLPVGALGSDVAPWAIGAGLPYGRITATALSRLTAAAACAGAMHARPSPSRLLVFPVTRGHGHDLLAAARQLGMILTEGDPRLRIDVCPGSPACARGTTSTREDADAIAEALRESSLSSWSVHVSGCAKGCARRGRADLTAVARNGVYDVIRDGDVYGAPLASGVSSRMLPGVVRALAGGGHG